MFNGLIKKAVSMAATAIRHKSPNVSRQLSYTREPLPAPLHHAARLFAEKQHHDTGEGTQIQADHQTRQHDAERLQGAPCRQPQYRAQSRRCAGKRHGGRAVGKEGRGEHGRRHQSRLRAAANCQRTVGCERIAHQLLHQHGRHRRTAAREQRHRHAGQGVVLHHQRVQRQAIGTVKQPQPRQRPFQLQYPKRRQRARYCQRGGKDRQGSSENLYHTASFCADGFSDDIERISCKVKRCMDGSAP